MTFSIRAIIRAFVAPDHRINCPGSLWSSLTAELCRRGAGQHEAGAFLLGNRTGTRSDVTDVIFYDQLDPQAYSSGVCILHANAIAELWRRCREKSLTVVADVHTHPGAAWQSVSDKANPMVARSGHVAIILPDFATAPVADSKIGIYEYLGEHQWTDQSPSRRPGFLYRGFWS